MDRHNFLNIVFFYQFFINLVSHDLSIYKYTTVTGIAVCIFLEQTFVDVILYYLLKVVIFC